MMKTDIPSTVRTVCGELQSFGYEAYIVGGCVRDALLGREPHDWDVCTSALPEDVQRIFERTVPTGIKHGTVTVLRAGMSIEVTTYRSDGAYSDGRRPDSVDFVKSLYDDLARRDFTINAMACEPYSGEIIDPFEGQGDLERKLIRAVGDPHARMQEDGLRAYRAARFAAQLGFKIDPQTNDAMISNYTWGVAMERVRDELLKTLAAPHATLGLRIMRDHGLLSYELASWIPRKIDTIIDDPIVRLGYWLGELGAGEKLARQQCNALKLSSNQTLRVMKIVRYHNNVPFSNALGEEWRRWIKEIGRENLDDVLATVPSSMVYARQRAEDFRDNPLYVADLAVNGTDLIAAGVPKGPIVGEVLVALLNLVLEEPSRNTRDILLGRVRHLGYTPVSDTQDDNLEKENCFHDNVAMVDIEVSHGEIEAYFRCQDCNAQGLRHVDLIAETDKIDWDEEDEE